MITATKTGWIHVGWNTDKTAKTGLNSIRPNRDDVLYAIYKKDLRADFQDFDGATPVSEWIYNKESEKTISVPTPRGHLDWNPIGWSRSTETGASVAVELLSGSSHQLTLAHTGATYYGLYERELTLSYHANGGDPVAPDMKTQYTNSATGNPSAEVFTLKEDPTLTIDADTSLYAVWRTATPASGLVYVKGLAPGKLNIFESTDTFAFEIDLANAMAVDAYVLWKAEDYFGVTVDEGTAEIQAGQTKVEPYLPTGGYHTQMSLSGITNGKLTRGN